MHTRKKICFVFGTRPEIIKLAPVIHECVRLSLPFITIHTGQHYSRNMDAVFIQDLKLPKVDYNLNVGSGTHAEQTAKMLTGIEKILLEESPAVVVVQGDTNSVLSGALAASKLHIPVAHVEAGLRSYDRRMPEEINRVMAGTVSDVHFAPTEDARENLIKEGVNDQNIYVTGNTVVDALFMSREIAKKRSTICKDSKLLKSKFGLVTVHRPENTDSFQNMKNICESLKEIVATSDIDLIWPIHPRTKKQLDVFELTEVLEEESRIQCIEPINFFDMIMLQTNAAITITDSGGLQEESCILGTPCITLRSNTERPESVNVGANILVGNNPDRIKDSVIQMLTKTEDWKNPFGDGLAAERIVNVLEGYLNQERKSRIQNRDLLNPQQAPYES